MSSALAKLRMIVFRIVLGIAACELAIGSVMLNDTVFSLLNFYFIFNALGIAAGALTFLTIPIMLLVDRYRKDSFITMVAVEVGWTFILWALWLATAVDALLTLSDTCVFVLGPLLITDFPLFAFCDQELAFNVLAFLAFGLLFIYMTTLVILALRQQVRGHANVWTGYVLETDFSAPGPSSSTSTYYPRADIDPKIMDGSTGLSGGLPHFAIYPSEETGVRADPTIA